MTHYYLSNDGHTAGPFFLSDLLSQGLTATSLVWAEGFTGWQLATDVAEVHALLLAPTPVLPPPLPSSLAYAAAPALVLPAPRADNLFTRHRAAWLTGGIVALLLLVVGLAQLSANGVLYATGPSAEQLAQAYADSVEQVAAQAQAEALAAEQRVEQERRQQRRRWHRAHFMEYVRADVLPGYRVLTFGGIADGHVQFTNKSGYKLREVVIAVQYIKAGGGTYKTEYLTLDELAAHESRVLDLPISSRGTSLYCYVQSLRTPGLGFYYNVDQSEGE